METKNNFAAFIADKRKKCNLTQKELADLIHVSESAVSKWERGVSYPDIGLISDICKVLNITEHEFITASDDIKTRENQKRLDKLDRAGKITQVVLISGYIIAIFVCFLCNIIIDKRLSWSLIVLNSIGIAFSIFNLPYFLKENKAFIALSSASILTYILLYIIKLTTEVEWSFIQAVAVITAWLLPVWGIYLIACKIKDKLIKSSLILIVLGGFTIIANPTMEVIINNMPFDITLTHPSNILTGILLILVAIVLVIIKLGRIFNKSGNK